MRWLRRRIRAVEGGEAEDAAADLDRALREPAGHTWALVAAAEAPETPEYVTVAEALERWPSRRWLELDAARLDAWSWYYGSRVPRGGWAAVANDPDAPTLLLGLISTHPDGFLRERATHLLAERSGALASAALAVRANDHVPQVRAVARRALGSHAEPTEALAAVPILLAARHREAAVGALEEYVESLPADSVRALARSPDAETRRFAVERAPLTSNELVRVAATDRDLRVRLEAAHRALNADPASARDLLAVRPATVRALATTVAGEDVVRPRLEQLLLDGSAHLRRAAQARARKLGVDAASVYRGAPPSSASVLGLGETGSDADVEPLARLVAGTEPSAVRRAAVRALGRLAPRELLLSLLPPLLASDQPSVARESARQLRRLAFSLEGGALDDALASPHVWTRRAALVLALGRRGWDAPVAALALYEDRDDSLREYARSALGSWLSRKAPTAGAPTPAQVQRLLAALDRHALPPGLGRQLRFHAGL